MRRARPVPERRIFEARRLADDPIPLEELAEEFGVSRERVRQIEVRAFDRRRPGRRWLCTRCRAALLVEVRKLDIEGGRAFYE